MRKLFIITPLFLFLGGSASNKVEVSTPISQQHPVIAVPLNTKIDSVNVKAAELQHEIEKL